MDGPIQLKELVTQKALPESANNPSITRLDVLRALKTDESRLFPAPCLIRELEKAVPREQESELFRAIMQASGIPIIVHAAGGVGKSVFATRIKSGLPIGSSSVLYDCFGNGQYRNASGYRHRHKDALVQIANELAAKGLCHPLIPTLHAGSSDYVRAFMYRLRQGITSLQSKNPHALLCIVLDAADNGQMAAEEIGEARSFVRDLLQRNCQRVCAWSHCAEPIGRNILILRLTHYGLNFTLSVALKLQHFCGRLSSAPPNKMSTNSIV